MSHHQVCLRRVRKTDAPDLLGFAVPFAILASIPVIGPMTCLLAQALALPSIRPLTVPRILTCSSHRQVNNLQKKDFQVERWSVTDFPQTRPLTKQILGPALRYSCPTLARGDEPAPAMFLHHDPDRSTSW